MLKNYQQKMRCHALLLCTALLFSGLALQAQTIKYVKQGGTGAGTSWADASGSLQAMIDASAANGQVWVAAGTYIPATIAGNGTMDRDKAFVLKSTVKVYGGFASSGNPAFTDRDWVSNVTILSGDLGTVGDVTDNAFHVVLAVGNESNPLSSTTEVNGFTITGGNANQSNGITVNGMGADRNYGGGIHMSYAGITVANTIISNNNAASRGGGISMIASTASLSHCSVISNTGMYGAGIAEASESNLTIEYSKINGNTAMYAGGGIHNETGQLSAYNTEITGNAAFTVPGAGTEGGGIYNYYYAGATLTNVTVSGNKCNGYGGGVLNYMATLTVKNSIVYGNYNGIINYENPDSVLVLQNSLVQGYTDTANGNINGTLNPGFANGPSYTTAPFITGNYAITSSCSPALNTGDNTYLPTGTLTDLAGNPRIYSGGVVDLGAYEFQEAAFNMPPTAESQTFNYGATVANLTATGLALQWYSSDTGGEALAPSTQLIQGTYYVTQTINGCESVRVPVAITILSYSVRYVKQGGTGDGTTWANASGDLQAMINAPIVEQVWVAAGTYKPATIAGNGTTDREKTFLLKNNVAVYGGFPATGNPAFTDRNWEENETILSGDLGTPGTITDNAYHVVLAAATLNEPLTANTILDGFTVTGGNANTDSNESSTEINGSYVSQLEGGGINIHQYASPTLANLNVTGNTAQFGGGLLLLFEAGAQIANSAFSNNTATVSGGGIYTQGTISLTNVAIDGNSCTNSGAGMYVYGAFGGGSCTFIGGSVNNNSSISNGAGIYNEGYCTFKNITVSGNVTTGSGGGIYNMGANGFFTNVLISGNKANGYGGGVMNVTSYVNFTNATIAGNDIVTSIAGVAFSGAMFNQATDPVITNTVMYGNDGGVVNFVATPVYTNSLVQGLTNVTDGNISGSVDPVFVDAPSSDTAPFTTGNYSLQNNSPLLNAGSNTLYATAGGTLETDLDLTGNSRVYDLANNGTIDIGAYEYEGDPGCLYTTIWSGTAWSNGTPTSNDYSAIINGDYTSAGDITACSLTVYDADVTIQTGDTFYIKGTIAVNNANASLTVQNNGAIVQTDDVANGGSIVFHKLANPLTRQKQTLWSSPVAGQNLEDFSPDTYPGTFWQYISQLPGGLEGPGYYSDLNASITDFEPGKGILIGMPLTITGPNADAYAADTYAFAYDGTFTGTPYNGAINAPLNTNGDLFTAIGNPYPSPLGVTNFFAAGEGLLDPASGIYLWSVSNNAFGYATVTETSFISESPTPNAAFTGNPATWAIAPGQGFLVQSAVTATAFPFSNSMRRGANATQPFFRMASTTLSRLWLGITSEEGTFMQTSVAYANGATIGLDYGMEAKMFGLSSANKIYSIAADTNLAIQTRPEFDATDVVPLGFVAPVAATYTITLNQFDGVFADGQDIYLKDNAQNGLTHNLKLAPYTFTSDAGTFNERFQVVYASTLGTASFDANTIVVYKNSEALHVDAGSAIISVVTLYDVSGRKLYSQQGINATTVAIDSVIAKNLVLIAEITTDHGTVKKKILY